VLRALLESRGLAGAVEVDSAGTGSWHVGEKADPRMRRAAAARGFALVGIARQVRPEDFDRFDLVVAMDRANLVDLEALNGGARPNLRLFSDFLPADAPRDVPDPYYGGAAGFDRVIDLIEEGAQAILEELLEGAR
jgi:protein-tyrosine phosphatase